MDYTPRPVRTQRAIRSAAASISSVVVSPRLKRIADFKTSSGAPIAASTGQRRLEGPEGEKSMRKKLPKKG